MRRLSAAQSAAILRDHRARAAVRFVDLTLLLCVSELDTSDPAKPAYVAGTDEVLIEVGGRWDRRRKGWAGDGHHLAIVRVPRGSDQEQPARWLAEWLRRFQVGPAGAHWDEPLSIPGKIESDAVEFRRVWTLMLVGGRRGGKTHLAVVALIAVALLAPRSQLWAISPTQDETDELEQAARSMLPSSWFTESRGKTNKTLVFKFANGSRLMFLSGHKPRALKRGRVDVALYNEGQNMYRAGWRQLRGAIADRGGLAIISCNPPDAEIGRWIEEVYSQARAKKIAAEAFHLRGSNNPFVTAQALEDMRREVDDVTARKEIDGEMGVPIGDVVFHAWSDRETIRPVPAGFVDVTAEVTKRELGRAFGYVVGLDFQKTPHMAAAIYKLFRDPDDASGEVLAWIVDEVVVDDADEDQLVDALQALERWTPEGRVDGETYRGWVEPGDDAAAPVHCGLVMDASAWYQSGDHQKGARSDRRLAARRWSFAYRPQKDSNDNPRIAERVKVTNARLKLAGDLGRRRMFSLAHNLRVNKAMRDWKNHDVTGAPNKHSDLAHCCDAASYVIFRLFGVPAKRAGDYRSAGRYSRGDDMKGF